MNYEICLCETKESICNNVIFTKSFPPQNAIKQNIFFYILYINNLGCGGNYTFDLFLKVLATVSTSKG